MMASSFKYILWLVNLWKNSLKFSDSDFFKILFQMLCLLGEQWPKGEISLTASSVLGVFC